MGFSKHGEKVRGDGVKVAAHLQEVVGEEATVEPGAKEEVFVF